MNREFEQTDELIDLGAASVETKGGPIPVARDELGFYQEAGLSDN